MKKEHISIIIPLIAIVPLVVVIITSFIIITAPEPAEPEVIIIQEEYRKELLEILDDILLLAYPVGSWADEWEPRVEIAPGIEIFSDRLAMYARVNNFANRPAKIATVEDIISLYDSYDEELDRRFRNLRGWLESGGMRSATNYLSAVRIAFGLYTQQFDALNGKEHFSDIRVEDMIALERFIRDNRSFMPRETYYRELFNMNIIDSEEYSTLSAAARGR